MSEEAAEQMQGGRGGWHGSSGFLNMHAGWRAVVGAAMR